MERYCGLYIYLCVGVWDNLRRSNWLRIGFWVWVTVSGDECCTLALKVEREWAGHSAAARSRIRVAGPERCVIDTIDRRVQSVLVQLCDVHHEGINGILYTTP